MHYILAQRQGERSLNFLVGHCSPCSGGLFWEGGREKAFSWEQLKMLIWEKLLELPKLGTGVSWWRKRGIFLWLLREFYKIVVSQKPCWEFLAWEQVCRKGRVYGEQERGWLSNPLICSFSCPSVQLCHSQNCNKAQLWFSGFLILSTTRRRRLWSREGHSLHSHFAVTQNLNP